MKLFKKNNHGLVPKGTLKSRELERPIKKDLLKNGISTLANIFNFLS